MTTYAERHHDAQAAADQHDERMSVAGWHELVKRASAAGWRQADLCISPHSAYAFTDAALREALPDRYPETKP